jgi:ribonucleoside-diphosphate reductase alpha chain
MRLLQARYLRRDAESKVIETPAQLFERVARAVAEAELLHTAEQREHFTKCDPEACRL